MGRYIQVDTATGEVVEGFVGVIRPKSQHAFGTGWFAVNQAALRTLRTSGLQGRDYDVLFLLLEHLDFENWIQVTQANLAKELEMSSTHFSRSIKKLIEIDALLEGPRIGRCKTYRLNPQLGWKGKSNGHIKALKERMKKAGMSVINSQDNHSP